jgi:hypothetical protein
MEGLSPPLRAHAGLDYPVPVITYPGARMPRLEQDPKYHQGFKAGARLARHLRAHQPANPLPPLKDPGPTQWTRGYRDGFNQEQK